jgi:hypothetical protein
VSTASKVALVLDPSGELEATVTRMEDWLLFSEPDSAEQERAVALGAEAAGTLNVALRHGFENAADLLTPDGSVELARLAVLKVDLRACVTAVRRAVGALPCERPPDSTLSALELLDRFAWLSRSDDARLLAAAGGARGERLKLSGPQYRAYRRFVRAALVDPLDRFVALGPELATRPAPVTSVGLGIER